MNIGLAVIYSTIFIVCVLVIIGFILLCRFLPDVQNPFKKQMKVKKRNGSRDISLNVVEAPRPPMPPVEKKTLKDAWNVISQEAKKELPTMKVEIARPLQPMPIQEKIARPLQPMPIQEKPKPKRKLTSEELEKRKIDTRPGKLRK
jgi:hypothetical protein